MVGLFVFLQRVKEEKKRKEEGKKEKERANKLEKEEDEQRESCNGDNRILSLILCGYLYALYPFRVRIMQPVVIKQVLGIMQKLEPGDMNA